MKNFLAIYLGTEAAAERSGWNRLSDAEREAKEKQGLEAWMQWGRANEDAIVDRGTPLGKTKRASRDGVADVKNQMVGYVIVRAASHEDAAQLFANHPHFAIFPGDSVEIMECLPLPSR
jgi:hypothetical protein